MVVLELDNIVYQILDSINLIVLKSNFDCIGVIIFISFFLCYLNLVNNRVILLEELLVLHTEELPDGVRVKR